VDRKTRKCIAYVVGKRDIQTVHKLYEKLKHLDAIFYTDHWEAFKAVIPKERHVIGKKHTITIEQNNSNTRHHLGRMTRRTKVVSKTKEMVDLTMRLWINVNQTIEFNRLQSIFKLAIFK
jgi:insertion element IS1 protein InsB